MLREIPEPKVKLEPVTEQGKPIQLESGWTVQGFRDQEGNHYERREKNGKVRWFRMSS